MRERQNKFYVIYSTHSRLRLQIFAYFACEMTWIHTRTIFFCLSDVKWENELDLNNWFVTQFERFFVIHSNSEYVYIHTHCAIFINVLSLWRSLERKMHAMWSNLFLFEKWKMTFYCQRETKKKTLFKTYLSLIFIIFIAMQFTVYKVDGRFFMTMFIVILWLYFISSCLTRSDAVPNRCIQTWYTIWFFAQNYIQWQKYKFHFPAWAKKKNVNKMYMYK